MSVHIGEVSLGAPVILAPMAGVTNPPFRQLCREFGEAGARAAGVELHQDAKKSGHASQAGLYVCEMITSRALIERTPETMTMIKPDPHDPVRSIQLYGVEPKTIAQAVDILVREDRADHIDLNFGCPVPKVTRKGGGSALPWKHQLFSDIVQGAVKAAHRASTEAGRNHIVPVTAKFRIGIDDEHSTFREVAKMSADAGISALTLHARTTEQHYSGQARWEYIQELKSLSPLPVFGNGDVFEADDAQRMMAQTGADGVSVGRGCQGRPWLFFDLVAAAYGSSQRYRPHLAQVADIIIRHAQLSVEHFADEHRAMRELRKHVGWYLRGFSVGGQMRHQLGLIESVEQLRQLLDTLDLDQPFPEAAGGPRGRAGGAKRPHLPEFWLDSHELSDRQQAKIHEAEVNTSGG
ncbi:tRNA dihydrouridine synthase DusB [Arcanobacterium pinnipediorum]|uniref:tRNA dihydrouridine synthase DusB n=1 Tax=Arcanobacterium pinnipediorum TaxID=1503041 RepID=A0ABY5AJ90_9ACTO|nr:tRNA dihydrouridine synthase DusB [Arcanobacterium pinnipediorum]USR80050.1 tRNA dihydrouridine synthase DusB [Arcanobacterium pinnipediorum]